MLGITFHGGIRCVAVVLWRDPFPHPRATWRSSKWGNGAAPTDKNFLFAWPPRKFWKESCSTTVITFRSDFIYQPTITTRLVLVKFIQSTGHQPGTVSIRRRGDEMAENRIFHDDDSAGFNKSNSIIQENHLNRGRLWNLLPPTPSGMSFPSFIVQIATHLSITCNSAVCDLRGTPLRRIMRNKLTCNQTRDHRHILPKSSRCEVVSVESCENSHRMPIVHRDKHARWNLPRRLQPVHEWTPFPGILRGMRITKYCCD